MTRKILLKTLKELPEHAQTLARCVTIHWRTVSHTAVRDTPAVGAPRTDSSEGRRGCAGDRTPTHRKLRASHHSLGNVRVITSGLVSATSGGVYGYVCAAVKLFLWTTSFADLAIRVSSKTVTYKYRMQIFQTEQQNQRLWFLLKSTAFLF